MDKTQILQKVEKVENDKEFFNRAISARICPECGSQLERLVGDFSEAHAESDITYSCRCGFKHETMEWPHIDGEETVYMPKPPKQPSALGRLLRRLSLKSNDE